MSHVTIQCRLVASEATRHQLWTLMADLNTPLINELLAQLPQHPDFETWREKGKLPPGIVKKLCQSLKSDPRFIGQPARFYTSAIAVVEYLYKAWLTLQKRLQNKRQGQIRWLGMLKSDEELVEDSNCSLESIRTKAAELLNTLSPGADQPQNNTGKKKNKKTQKKDKTPESNKSASDSLFQAYDKTDEPLNRAAIAYLLKNGCRIRTKPENPKKFAKRRRKVEIKIQRLSDQLESRIPKGRDLTGNKWLETLAIASTTVPQHESEAKSWQDQLLREPKPVPFPVGYETNEDLTWSKNEKGRLCVRFNGLSEHTFQIYCDQRQLKWFERFYEDQEVKRGSKDQHSSALFTLRSARIGWQEGTGKGDPWTVNFLTLYCTLDTRFWTAEGTEQIRQAKASEVAKVLTNMKEKGDLTDKQQAFVKRKNSTLERLENPFPRPSQPLYQGQPHILVSVALGLDKPATVAIVDISTGKAISYRSLKQLLGDNYHLLNQQRQQKRESSHKRHKNQKRAAANRFGDSNLGEYIDRLLAKAIVTLAQTYHAGTIVLPKLRDMREIVQSEIKLRAEQKIPGYIEGQEKYAKQYRVNVHQWSYGRLIDNINAQAAKFGILIEEGVQPIRGSPQEKAREMAIAAYHARSNS
ncbi:MAG: type V CRISPR-associated protein Cas12k [Cyanobacteriota bacterium]